MTRLATTAPGTRQRLPGGELGRHSDYRLRCAGETAGDLERCLASPSCALACAAGS